MVDPAQFELALLNVAFNARDAMPDGGLLRFEAENVTLHESKAGLEGDYVAVRVTDTGAGIPKNLLERVLEPFFTTKPVGQGTGLGLSQAYGFAKQSGGALMIDSEVGKGTTITFYLPASLSAAPVSISRVHAARTSARGLQVLVVEDEPARAGLATRLLEQAGHRVTRVEDPQSALDVLGQGMTSFDLVLADALLPGGMSGLDLARTIRKRWPMLPVLLASSDGVPQGEDATQEFPVVQKPYGEAELTRAVTAAVPRATRA
jgi:CheY-like chemotaxis protein